MNTPSRLPLPFQRKLYLSVGLAIGLAALISSQSAQAAGATHTISNTSGTTNWSASTWVGGTPDNTTVGDTVTRTTTANNAFTTTLDTAVTIGRIIQNGGFGSATWTIASDANSAHFFTLDNTGGSGTTSFIGASGANQLTIGADILVTNTDLTLGQTSAATFGAITTLSGSLFVANGQTRSIFLSSPLTTTGAVAVNVTGAVGATAQGGGASTANINISSNGSTVGGTQTFTLGGPIGGAVGTGSTVTISNTNAGTGALSVTGALNASVTTVTQNSTTASMSLSGVNSNYVGVTTLTSGKLSLGSTTALGGNAATLVINGGSLDSSVSNLVLANTNAITANNDFTFTGTQNLSLAGTVSLGSTAGNRSISTTANTLTLNGIISNGTATGLTKLGSGTLALTAANAYTGATTLGTTGSGTSGGTLTLGGANGAITTSSGITIVGIGSKLTLDNATTINNDRIANNVTLSLGGEMILTGNGATGSTTEAFGALGLDSGSSIVTVGGIGAGQLTTLSSISFARGSNFATALVRSSSLGTNATNSGRVLINGASGTGLTLIGTSQTSTGVGSGSNTSLKIVPYLIGDLSVAGTGSNFVTYDTTSGLRPLGANEQAIPTAGYTTAANPDNAKQSTSAGNTSLTLTNASGITVNSWAMLTGATNTLNSTNANALTVNSGAVGHFVGSGTATIGSGFSQLNLDNSEGVVTVLGTGVLTVATPIDVTQGGSHAATGALTKAGAGTLTLTGANLYTGVTTINAGTLQIGNGTTGSITSGSAITVNVGATLAINQPNNSTFANNIVQNGTLTVANTGTQTLSGTISGTSGITQATAATSLILTGNNTYTGLTTVSAGTLVLSGDNSAATGGLTQTGGTVDLRSAKAVAGALTTSSAGMIVNGTGGALALSNISSAVLGGGFILGSTANTAGNGDINFGTGTVSYSSAAGTLLMLGTGATFRFDGVATNTSASSTSNAVNGAGNTLVFGNTIVASTGGTNSLSTFTGTGNISILGAVTNGPLVANSALGYSGFGTLTLGGNNTYTGSTNLNSGTVVLDYSTNATTKISGIGTGGTLTLAGSVSLNLNTGAVTETVGNWNLNAGANSITRTGGSTGKIVAATLTRGAGGTLALSAGGIFNTTTGGNNALFTTTAGVVGVVGGNDWAAKAVSGNDVVGLSALASNYTNSGASTVTGNSDVIGNVTFAAAATPSATTLRFNTAGVTTIDASGSGTPATLSLTQGGILVTSAVGANLTTITGGTLKPGSNNALFIFQNNTSGGLTINSIIADGSAASALTKSGAGLLTLTNTNNSYTGKTYLNQGTLNIAAETSLGVTPGTVTADQLTMAGGTLQFANVIALSANRGLTITGGGNMIDTNGFNATIAGIIANGTAPGSLTKTGTGTLTLSGLNTFTGPFKISGGTVNVATLAGVNGASSIGNGGRINQAQDLVLDGGMLQYTGTTAASTVRQYTLTTNGGGFDASGTTAGTLTFSGAMTASGTSGSQTLTLTGTGSGATGGGTLSGTINNGAGTNVTALNKTGTGTWTLSAANTYSGDTTITGGTLAVTNNLALQNSAFDTSGAGVMTVTGATTPTFGGLKGSTDLATAITTGYSAVTSLTLNPGTGSSNTYSGVISNGAAGMTLTKTGAGTQTLSGTNTYTGATTISGGKLSIGSTGSINSSSGISIAGGNFNYNSATALTPLITFSGTGGTLSGSGTVGAFTLTSGNTLSPGNSPGLLTTGAQTWVNGGNYNWQMLDATGAAGTGFDSTAITSGGLNLSGLTTGGFNINLWSLSSTGPDVNGDALNFDNSTSHSWTLVSNTGDLTSIAGSVFNVNISALNGTSGFSNALAGGTFTVVGGLNSLDLVFTAAAIPEPSTCAAIFGALALAGATLRRRARKS